MSGRLNWRQRNDLRVLSESDSDEESSHSENKVRLRRTTRALHSASHNNLSHDRGSVEASAIGYRSTNHVNSNNNFSSAKVGSIFSPDDGINYNYNCSTPNDSTVLNQRSFSVNSSQMDVSSIHESSFHRLRWVVWRYIYLKMISNINFDVWLLSRLRGSRKALLILLLPLLLYILYSSMIHEDELIHKSYMFTSSSLSSFISSFFSLLAKPFTHSQKLFEEFKKQDYFGIHSLLPSFSALSGYFSGLFVKTEERTYFVHRTSTSSKEASSAPIVESLSKEQVKSLAVNVLEERLNDVVQKIQLSNSQHLEDVKGGTALLQKEISDLRLEFKSLSTLLQQFQNDVQKLEISSTKDVENLSAEHKTNINLLNTKIKAFEEKLDSLGTLKGCCDEKMNPADFIASIEKHLVAAFRSVVDNDKSSSYHFFSEWLNSKFTDPKALSSKINHVFEGLKKEQYAETKQDTGQLKIIEGVVHHYLDSMKANMTLSSHLQGFLRGSLTNEDVRRIVREAILLYDADKTGLVDYALESAGGSILSTRCSESYTEKKASLSLLGLSMWSVQNTPRTAIQPDVQPGQCWSFKGSQGFLVIQLSYTIHPTGFTLEHIPVSLSPTGSIDSAPKDFSVWGLSSEADNEGTVLGKYSYDDKGEPLQYFAVQNLTKEPFSYVELKIHNNHGHLEYTCLYRFRVHGTRVK